MLLIALALGLILEQLATAVLHLRELRWFDRYYDAGLRLIADWPAWAVYPGLILILAVPVAPVLIVSLVLQDPETASDVIFASSAQLTDVAYLAFAVLIVFFCLGPRDLGREVDDYCEAIERGDDEAAERVLLEMAETQRARKSDIEVVEDAVFVQSNNRIFGVIFWFVLLGPVGAWIFRVSDLLRRRVVFEQMRGEGANASQLAAIEAIYGLLKWIPARLAMLGYALTGSFDDAMNAWRAGTDARQRPIDERNDLLIARVGKAALGFRLRDEREAADEAAGADDAEPESSSAAARSSMRLVRRTVFIWVIAIALMTLFGQVL